MGERVYGVYEINQELKLLIEESFPPIFVEGEISNLNRHSSGHIYLTLKDAKAQLSCTIWKTYAERLAFEPGDGMKIVARGKLNVFERAGRYQFSIFSLQPAGQGELQLKFEQLKQKLLAEGLFDAQHKQALPNFPFRIGVVTSASGAAIEDIIQVLSRRAPYARIVLNPVKVQGEGAAREISTAVRDFNEFGEIDVMIVGRGGGSLEDLWAFNEEEVARAIFESRIPVISAVGHETDFSICDLVSDLRAPTPSAAAELVVRDLLELNAVIVTLGGRITNAWVSRVSDLKTRIEALAGSHGFRQLETNVRHRQQTLDELVSRMTRRIGHHSDVLKMRLGNARNKLVLLSHEGVLKRGYSITCDKAGKIVRDANTLAKGDQINIRFHRGSLDAEVREIDPGSGDSQG